MSNIIKSFSYKTDKEPLIKKINELADKEGKKFSELIIEVLEQYAKQHADGNPQYQIDQFADPDFIACPAFYRDGRTWENYISKAEPKELEKLKQQIILIDKKLGMYL